MLTTIRLQKYITDAQGKRRLTQQWDPVSLTIRQTRHGRAYAAQAVAALSVEIPVIMWVTETGRTFEQYLAWDHFTDTQEELRVLRSVNDSYVDNAASSNWP